jgi:hypothetical protein
MMWNVLTKDVQLHCKKCNLYQIHTKNRKQYGKIYGKLAEAMSWKNACVCLVGPSSVKSPSGVKKLRAFTAIDPATALCTLLQLSKS